MPLCPKGHQSDDAVDCSECGRPMNGIAVTPAVEAEPELEWDCPNGHPGQVGRFCEVDGYDSQLPPDQVQDTPIIRRWVAVVGADREFYDLTCGEDDELDFPESLPTRQFPLHGDALLIGRKDAGLGIRPEIDLTGPPEDRAVGREHAALVAQDDGTWAIVDRGSANGTHVNDRAHPIPAKKPVPLHNGDQIFLGAWTVITIQTE